MKVLELFAGERCIGKAFEKKGHEVYSVEWDKSHPGCQCYQDVNNLTPEFILEQFGQPDVVWMSPDCFPAGTLIWTRNGYKPVEEINCFDEVLTHKNRYRRVYATQKTNKHDIYNIKISGCETVTVSSEHPYYVRKKLSRTTRIKGKSVRISGLDTPKWVKAKDLTTDYKVGIPINGESKIPQWHGCMYETRNSYGRTRSWIKNDLGKFMDNRDFWWVVGRYFGDGSLSASKYTVDITCAFDEVDEINPVLSNLGMKFSLYKKETASHFTICDKEWVEFLSQFGVGALEKQITPAILDLPVELLTAFLEGYISADGHQYNEEGNPKCTITTVSKKLAYGIQLCILKAYGRYASMVVRSNQNNVICGREVNVHPAYKIEFHREYNNRSQYVIEDGIAWVNIRSVEKPSIKQTTVYNFSVEEDESYTANNIIVHNCTTFSVAAISHHRRLNPETKNLDPISDYAKFCDKTDQHCLWLISQLKPKFFFVENPRGAMRKMTWMQDFPRYTVTYCLAGETKVVTADGERPIADLVDTTQRLLTKDGTWVDAPIRCYGTQELMKINLTRHNVTKTIYATPNHLWFTKSKGVRLVETKDLKPKMYIDGVALKPIKCKIIDSWVARGFTYGDGWVLKDYSRKHAFAMFCDEKSEMIPYFNGYCGKVYYDTHNGKKVPKVYGMPMEWKTEMPTPHNSVDEIYSWLAGYFAADGSVGLTNGQLTLYSAKLKDLETVRSLCRTVGIGTYDITSYTRKGYGTEETPMYAMTIMKGDVTESFFLRKFHREKYMEHAVTKHQARRWRVVSVESTDRIEPVYCADVPNSHSFVIEGDIVTHNCKYGDTRMKPTDIWTNHPDPQFKPPCKNGDPCHEPAPRGSRTGTQGRQGSVIRSLIPEELCDHIVDICEQYIDKV